jgi:hypothetical protein
VTNHSKSSRLGTGISIGLPFFGWESWVGSRGCCSSPIQRERSAVAIVPSYIAKVARAKKHLVDLKTAIDGYAAQHPYTVRERMEGKKNPRLVRYLDFTAHPADTDIPIIAADAIYNLRSALDHLMSTLVAKKDRSSAIFPVYFEGVWDGPLPGEDTQRLKLRQRWASDTKTIRSEAVTVLKRLQPPDEGWLETNNGLLRLINRLSNRDRHEKLPVVAPGLIEFAVRYKTPEGQLKAMQANMSAESVLQDKAVVAGIPDDAVDVEVEGVPLVAIDIAHEVRYIALPLKLDRAALFIAEVVIPELMPYVQRA